jgi:hypothetical protein
VIVLSGDNRVEVPIKMVSPESVFDNQVVAETSLSRRERKVWEETYAGEVELVDNVIGRIDEITIVNRSRGEILEVMKAFPDREFVIVHGKQSAEFGNYESSLIDFLKENGVEDPEQKIRFVESQRSQAGWARDYFLQAQDPETGEEIFIETPHVVRNMGLSHDMADTLDNERIINTNLYFEGGDFRAVGPYLFMGEATFDKAISHMKQSLYTIKFISPTTDEIVSLSGINMYQLVDEAREKYIEELGPELVEYMGGEDKVREQIDESFYEEARESEKPIYVIGEQQFDQSAISEEEATNILRQEYESFFGRELMVVGEGDEEEQAIFHIDMFATFLPSPPDKPVVLVADQSMAAEILSGLSQQELEEIEKSMLRSQFGGAPTSEDLVAQMGESRSGSFLGGPGKGLSLKQDIAGQLHGYTEQLTSQTKQVELQQRMDGVAEWFEEQGFEVQRIPSAVSYYDGSQLYELEQNESLSVGEKTHRNYNNVLLEVYTESGQLVKNAYMPTFGMAPLEAKAVEIYNQNGYTVIPVSRMIDAARAEGVLNCIVSENRSGFVQRRR